MRQEGFNEQFRNRTKVNSVKIIKIVSKIKYSDESSVIKKQIIKCATSVAANYRKISNPSLYTSLIVSWDIISHSTKISSKI